MHKSKKKWPKNSCNSKRNKENTWQNESKLHQESNQITKVPLKFHSITRKNREVECTIVKKAQSFYKKCLLFLHFRLVHDLSKILQPIVLVAFTWSMITISGTMLMFKIGLVQYHCLSVATTLGKIVSIYIFSPSLVTNWWCCW